MGHNWLDGMNWRDITRTERYFVWKLAAAIQPNPVEFLRWINKNTDLRIGKLINGRQNPSNFEVATDVRFFNDFNEFAKANPALDQLKGGDRSEFDLVIFSRKLIVIFEAKAWGSFEGKGGQLHRLRRHVPSIAKVTDCEVKLIGIHSSRYSPSGDTRKPLDTCITWQDASEHFEERDRSLSSIFLRADRCYKNKTDDGICGLTDGYDLSSKNRSR